MASRRLQFLGEKHAELSDVLIASFCFFRVTRSCLKIIRVHRGKVMIKVPDL